MSASKKELQELKSELFNEGEFDFNALVPIPKELVDTEAGSGNIHITLYPGSPYRISPASVARWIQSGKTQAEVDEMIQKEKELIDAFGAINWYDWSVNNWGVKWNACETQIIKESDSTLELWFQTPWSAPEPVYDVLFEKYPNLSFIIECEFEGDDNGIRYISNGIGEGSALSTTRHYEDENGNWFTAAQCNYDEEEELWTTPYGDQVNLWDLEHKMVVDTK